MFSYVTSLSSAAHERAEYSRGVLPDAGINAFVVRPLATLLCISAEKSSVATAVRNFSFAKRPSAIFQPSLIRNTIYRFCMRRALHKKSNLIYYTFANHFARGVGRQRIKLLVVINELSRNG